jgi:hypothetical protein
MKHLSPLIIAVLLLCYSCKDNVKQQKKAALDSVLAIHDKVMADEGALMDHKLLLDSLSKTPLTGITDTVAEKQRIKLLSKKLDDADQLMENWMQKFQPDPKGISPDATITYMADQKKKVTKIDSQMKAAVQEADAYLKNIKKK